jgi:hypothetical protein
MLNSSGIIALSTIFGGQGSSRAVAIAADGNILVSGYSFQKGFPSTPDAYSVSDTTYSPYLIKLDPATPKVLFSATGIGGTSIALDTAGNIFVSGLTGFPSNYPTTPGAYQTQFFSNDACELPCQEVFPGPNQYVTKIDPTGSKLIYSTGLNPPNGSSQIYPSGDPNAISMTNAGLVVDTAGNAYVTVHHAAPAQSVDGSLCEQAGSNRLKAALFCSRRRIWPAAGYFGEPVRRRHSLRSRSSAISGHQRDGWIAGELSKPMPAQ